MEKKTMGTDRLYDPLYTENSVPVHPVLVDGINRIFHRYPIPNFFLA
jgi:hypothetical protein